MARTSKVLTLLLLGLSLGAQAMEEFAVDESPSAFPSPSLTELMDAYLAERGWSEGENQKKDGSTFLVAIGRGTIGAGRTTPSFITSRQLAFDKAMLQAKRAMLEYQEAKIKTEMSSFFAQPSQARQQAELAAKRREGLAIEGAVAVAGDVAAEQAARIGTPSAQTLADKTMNLLRLEAAERLQALGYDPSQPVDAQTLQAVVEEEGFQKTVETAAQGRLVGMQAAKTFEFLPEGMNGEIGVITIHSARLQSIADAIYSNQPARGPSGSPKKPLAAQIPQSKDALVSEFGVKAKRNEKGEYCLVAYGQSSPRTQSSRSLQAAESQAKLVADGLIRQFAGEMGTSLAMSEQAENIKTYADNMQDYALDESYEEKIAVSAKAIVISGIAPVKRWTHTHPLGGQMIAGVVSAWCPSQGLSAQASKRQMSAAPKAQEGFSSGGAAPAGSMPGAEGSGRRALNSDQSGATLTEGSDVDEEDF